MGVFEGQVTSAYWRAKGKTIDKSLRFWNAEAGECVRGFEGLVTSMYQTMASGSPDKSVRRWNAETGECPRVLEGHSTEVTSLSWSPDGKLLVSGSRFRDFRIWDTSTGFYVFYLVILRGLYREQP